jgi:tetratricopeptide (TPR) repeat protein
VKRSALLAVLACYALAAQSTDRWTGVKNSHLEVYSQTGPETARATFSRFAQLRAFFEQNILAGAAFSDQARPSLRVVCLREQEYEMYRPRPIADAYYATDGSRDYIVMAEGRSNSFGIAAHEYVHYVLHARGWKLPASLSEGIAEYFATLRLRKSGYEIGGILPARMQTLRRNEWLPLTELLDQTPETRKAAEIFYAESWALADLLLTSPAYASHFRELADEFGAGSSAPRAFRKVYGKSLAELTKDLENWTARPKTSRAMAGKPVDLAAGEISELSARQAQVLLAQISLASDHLEKARTQYEELLRGDPSDPDLRVSLGTIALRLGNREEALKQWQLAIGDNVKDAELCYRFALLAEEAGFKSKEIRDALERAVVLAPGFDDARYKLALLEDGAGEYRSAIDQLRAMRVPTGARQYVYWTVMASALTELDERDEAQDAAQKAAEAATTEDDKASARRMAYTAATDLKVRFATDSQGHSQIVTTRVPHGATDWNPFIEPSDRMQQANGRLAEVLCTAGKLTGFLLRTPEGQVTVEVRDPWHVLMRNSPAEFYCGRTQEAAVEADFAVMAESGKTKNVLRGMTFH